MRLNRDKRYQIKALLNVGLLQKDIANQVGMTPGALSKELNRNGGKDKYDPDRADRRARKQARKNHVHYKFSDEVWAETEALTMEDLSPEQAVGRRTLERKESPSVPTIYRHLRHGNKKYRERGPAKDGRGSIAGQTPIDLRPAIVDEKSRFGDFEIDLINGARHKGTFFTANDRMSKKMNGLIRQYLPKGTSFENLTRAEVKWTPWKLNNRPGKRLGYLTPLEYISKQIKQIYLAT